MKFIARFRYNGDPLAWRIYQEDNNIWFPVLCSDNQPHASVEYFPMLHTVDGDFKDEAESLEDFIEKHIEVFL